MAVLEVRDVSTHFGGVKAVDGVDLAVSDGEFLVLLGASGSGKTTLMRTIAGLERPTAGNILIDGRSVDHLGPNARNVAMVFQSYALYPHKSAFRNISFPLEAVRMDGARIRERVEWAANLFGIAHLLERRPRELSGGERQRVALARAMVREPNLFLLDEPLSNLDAKLRHLARHELKKLHRQTGVTTIYVTHDQVEAMGLGERVAVMNHGKIEQVGTPAEIYREPANTFVAEFMGAPAMNLLEREGEIIGFHPENFLPVAHFEPTGEVERFSFFVFGEEDLGSDALIYGSVDGTTERPDAAVDVAAKAAHSRAAPGGERGAPDAAGVTSGSREIIAKLPARLAGTVAPGRTHEFFVSRHSIKRFDRDSGRRVDLP
jgi:multiple sugar transport system ATP-binding protein